MCVVLREVSTRIGVQLKVPKVLRVSVQCNLPGVQVDSYLRVADIK